MATQSIQASADHQPAPHPTCLGPGSRVSLPSVSLQLLSEKEEILPFIPPATLVSKSKMLGSVSVMRKAFLRITHWSSLWI